MSLLMGFVLPVLGIAGITIYNERIGSGKFCPYCDANLYLRKNVMRIHSCNTSELIKRINENSFNSELLDIDTPKMSPHAFTTVDLCICKKQGCRHGIIDIYQHMMHMTYDKQNKQWVENDVNQLIKKHEISGDIFDSWIEKWDKKDTLA